MVAPPELLMPQSTPCALFPAGLIEQSFFNPPKPVVRLEGGGIWEVVLSCCPHLLLTLQSWGHAVVE